nr:serine/threonine protein kinase [Clostridiales bacterium]
MNIKPSEPLWGTWYLQEIIGAGSYGIVYRAQQTILNHVYSCAVKHISLTRDDGELYAVMGELATHDQDVLRHYFQQEMQSIADEYDVQKQFTGNANFVQVYDILPISKQDMPGFDLFIRMELLDPAQTRFTKKLPQGETEKEVIQLGKNICSALQKMHARHYLHRDIKPQNILVSEDGIYKLADFGTARRIGGSSSSMSMKGTLDYMAPEIVTGKKVGFSSDLYSLGLVLYYFLNRQQLPFASADQNSHQNPNIRRFAGEPLPPPGCASPEITQIILKACAYNPEERYCDASAM